MRYILNFLVVVLFIALTSCEERGYSSSERDVMYRNIDLTDSMDEGRRRVVLDSLTMSLFRRKYDSLTGSLLFRVAGKYYNNKNYEKYAELSRKILNVSTNSGDSLSIAKSLHYLGDYHDMKSQMDSALTYYTASEKLYRSLKDSVNTGRIQLYKAGILYNIGGFAESETLTVDALRFLKSGTNSRLVYECYVQMALSLKELGNYKTSLHYFDLALQTLVKLENELYDATKIAMSRAACLNNIGQVYFKQETYPKAIHYFETGLKTVSLKEQRPSLYATLLNNLASAKMYMNETANVENMLFESLKIREAENLKYGIVSSKIKIGEFYLAKGDTVKALDYIKQGYELAKQINSNYDILKGLTLLSQNDKENMAYYTGLYISSNEHIYHLQMQTRNKFGRIAYETELMEERNKILLQKNTYIIILALITAILFLAILYIYKLNAAKKELLYRQEQQKSNEKIYNLLLTQQSMANKARDTERRRIAMDLHDTLVNKVFTTRFNLMQLQTKDEAKKKQLVEELEATQNDIRKISHDLSENMLPQDIGFREMIKDFIKSQEAGNKLKFDLHIDKFIDWNKASGELKINLYSIIQEAVQNVIKHSGASLCTITFFLESGNLKLRIWDNGKGFDPKKQVKGIGLKNLYERVRNIKGDLNIESKPDKGTSINILVSLIKV